MSRIKTLSTAAAEDPSWERVQARILWLMADKSKTYDDIVASRQRVFQQPGFADAMRDAMALQDPEIRPRTSSAPTTNGASPQPDERCVVGGGGA
jgi:2-hydroxy-6-oxonona-2,4-dienedioate hydrolase